MNLVFSSSYTSIRLCCSLRDSLSFIVSSSMLLISWILLSQSIWTSLSFFSCSAWLELRAESNSRVLSWIGWLASYSLSSSISSLISVFSAINRWICSLSPSEDFDMTFKIFFSSPSCSVFSSDEWPMSSKGKILEGYFVFLPCVTYTPLNFCLGLPYTFKSLWSLRHSLR